MRRVAIVGAGQTPYGDHPTLGIKEMFNAALGDAMQSVDRGVDPREIQAAYVGTLGSGGFQIGQPGALVAGYAGLPPIPVYHLENACASGGFALLAGVTAILSGLYDLVLVAGMEKMTDLSSAAAKYWLGVSGDTEFERLAGLTFAGLFALTAQRYMLDYGMPRETLSRVAVKNHRNGALNPKAHLRRAISLERALAGPPVAHPLNVFDCCPISDGAAVVLLASEERARSLTDAPVFLRGFGSGSDHLALHSRDSVTSLRASRKAAEDAYRMAGVGPGDVAFAEVHDCFTIAEIVAYEDLGFAQPGQGWRLIEEGATTAEGRLPVNLSGGLKAKGHPLGATGVGQAYEVFNQLRGEAQAPERQVRRGGLALTHNIGGIGGTAVVCIYEGGEGW